MRKLKVLIVEDSPADAELLVQGLLEAGFAADCQRVESEAAYRQGLQNGMDLVLADYRLPQFSGLCALELLRQSGLEVPFILVSGTVGEDAAVEAIKLGASDYLLKDRLARLGAAVTHALDDFRLRRERRAADEALRSAHSKMGQLLEYSPAVLYVLRLVGDKATPSVVSENITRVLGFTTGLDSALVPISRMALAMGKQHPLARRSPVSLAELACEAFLYIGETERHDEHLTLISAIFAARGIKHRPVKRVNGFESLVALVASGYGLSVLRPFSLSRGDEGMVFRRIEEDGDDLRVRLLAVWSKNLRSQLARNFVEALQSVPIARLARGSRAHSRDPAKPALA